MSNKNGKSKFGGNGELGNSESTLLVNNNIFFTYNGRHNSRWKNQQNHIIDIETITIETLLEEQNIKPEEITLLKMDIEGGEIILIPHLKKFLKIYKPTFYISLHYCFLKIEDIKLILDILFDIYENCFYFTNNGNKIQILKEDIIKYSRTCLVFE